MTAAARAVIFGCEGKRLSSEEKRFFAEAQPWGAILFARNVGSPDQLRALSEDWRQALGRNIPILIDQEGGRVQRMGPPYWRDWMPALQQTAKARDPARAMYLRGRLIAQELRAVGIDVNCAPLADIAQPGTTEILRNRCYGQSLTEVVANASAMAEGLRDGGVLPVLKHMPGHGRAGLDSHVALPVVTACAATLRAQDFASFAALANLPLAMTAHVVYAAFDPENPATTSDIMIRHIRDEIGFQGALMTDDLSMQALIGTMAARAEAALGAGCDLVLHCNGDMTQMRELVLACPELSGQSLVRCDRSLAARNTPCLADIDALLREYATLMAGGMS